MRAPDPPLLLPGRWAVAARWMGFASAVILVALCVAQLSGRADWVDERVADRLESDDANVLHHANGLLEITGSFLVMGAAVATSARLAWFRWRCGATTAFAIVAPITATLMSDVVLKPLVASTWPSGTTAAVTALGGSAIVLLAAHASTAPRLAVLVTISVVAAVALALLLTGYHTATDIVGGLALGVLVTCVSAHLHDRLDAG